MSELDRDAAARHRITTDLETTFVVEAAAGTGKTASLVARILALIVSGRARLNGIVAVTFTDKAAGEMRLRVRAAIEEALTTAPPDDRRHLERALEELELARIGTIHGFCSDLLRERPVEADVDPSFRVAAEGESRELFERAADAWFQRVLAAPPEGVRRLCRRHPTRDDLRARDLLVSAGYQLVQTRDFPAAYARPEFDRHGMLATLMTELERLGNLALLAFDPEDWLTKSLALVARFVDEVRFDQRHRGLDDDELEARLRYFRSSERRSWNWAGRRREFFGKDILRESVVEQRSRARALLDQTMDLSDADLAACLREDLRPVVNAYEELKRQVGCIDFLDLLISTRRLLMSSEGVRRDLRSRCTHVLVDEAQDTDPLQADILLFLAADDPTEDRPEHVRIEPGRLFLVGDPKQSIYRFRRADVAVYRRLADRLERDGAEALFLSRSFRSDPRLQRFVNAAFADAMVGDHQASYVPLEPHRSADETRPAVIALPVARPYGDFGKVVGFRIAESEPETVAAFVSWLLKDSGFRVHDPDVGDSVPVAPRHVCLLFRRFQSFGRPITIAYTEGLERRGLRHVLAGGRTFHDREEVQALRLALDAIEWPDDEMSVFGTLRGPFLALRDATLLHWRESVGRLHPLRPSDAPLPHPDLEPVAAALAVLGELHRQRNRRRAAETVSAFLDATRALGGLSLWHGGEQAVANVLRVVELARRVESEGATSFRSFLERLAFEGDHGDGSEAAIVEDGADGVRVMTVHRAKGLEFPVVVLCDLTCGRIGSQPSRYVDATAGLWAQPLAGCLPTDLLRRRSEVEDRDHEEADRLLYVATTRARDLLVVPTVGDEPIEGWLDRLNPVLYPPSERRRRSSEAPGCPAFGPDSVAERPPRSPGTESSVRPGQHETAPGVAIVWWDPKLLEAQVPRASGLLTNELLAEGPAAATSSEAFDAWRTQRALRRATGTRTSIRVRTPRDAPAPVREAATVTFEETSAQHRTHLRGPRFGSLVHLSLELIDLRGTASTVAQLVTTLARQFGVEGEGIAQAISAVIAALAHPRMQAAARSDDVRREVQLTCTDDDGQAIEGTADLVYADPDDGHFVVIDFKTSTDRESHRAEHAAQVGWYVRATAEATGRRTEGVVLSV